jgi:hypothetical protein
MKRTKKSKRKNKREKMSPQGQEHSQYGGEEEEERGRWGGEEKAKYTLKRVYRWKYRV